MSSLISEKVRYIGKAPNTPQINSVFHYVTWEETGANQTITFENGYGTNNPDVILNGVRLDVTDYTAVNGSTITFAIDVILAEGDIIEVISFDFETIPLQRNTLNLIFYGDYIQGIQTGSDPVTFSNLPISPNDHINVYLNGVWKDDPSDTIINATNKTVTLNVTQDLGSSDTVRINVHKTDSSELLGDDAQTTLYYFNNAVSTWTAVYYDSTQGATYLAGKVDQGAFETAILVYDSAISTMTSGKASTSYVNTTFQDYVSNQYLIDTLPGLVQSSAMVFLPERQAIDGTLVATPRINNLWGGNDYWLTQPETWWGDYVTGEPQTPVAGSVYYPVTLDSGNDTTSSGYGLGNSNSTYFLNNLILQGNSPQTDYRSFTYNGSSWNSNQFNWDWFDPDPTNWTNVNLKLKELVPIWHVYTEPWDGLNGFTVLNNPISIDETFNPTYITETIQIGEDYSTGGRTTVGLNENVQINNRLPAWDGGTSIGGGTRNAKPYFIAQGTFNDVNTGVLWGHYFTDLLAQGKLQVGQVFEINATGQNGATTVKGVISSVGQTDPANYTRFFPGFNTWGGYFYSAEIPPVIGEMTFQTYAYGFEDSIWKNPLILYTPYDTSVNVPPLSTFINSNGTMVEMNNGITFQDGPLTNGNWEMSWPVSSELDYTIRPRFTDAGWTAWKNDGYPTIDSNNAHLYPFRYTLGEQFSYTYPFQNYAFGLSSGAQLSSFGSALDPFFQYHDRTNSGLQNITIKLYSGEYSLDGTSSGTLWGRGFTGNESIDNNWLTFQSVAGSQRQVSNTLHSFFGGSEGAEEWTEHLFTAYGGTEANPTNWSGNSVNNPQAITPQFWIPSTLANTGLLPSSLSDIKSSGVNANVETLPDSYLANLTLNNSYLDFNLHHGSDNSIKSAKKKYGLCTFLTSDELDYNPNDRSPFNINLIELWHSKGYSFPYTHLVSGSGESYYMVVQGTIEMEVNPDGTVTLVSGIDHLPIGNGEVILQPYQEYNSGTSTWEDAYSYGLTSTELTRGTFDNWHTQYGNDVEVVANSVVGLQAGVYFWNASGTGSLSFEGSYSTIFFDSASHAHFSPSGTGLKRKPQWHSNNDWLFGNTITAFSGQETFNNLNKVSSTPRTFKAYVLKEKLGWLPGDGSALPEASGTGAVLAFNAWGHNGTAVEVIPDNQDDAPFWTNTNHLGIRNLAIFENSFTRSSRYSVGSRRLYFIDKNYDAVTTALTQEEQKEVAYVECSKLSDERVEIDWRLVAFDAEAIDNNPRNYNETNNDSLLTGGEESPTVFSLSSQTSLDMSLIGASGSYNTAITSGINGTTTASVEVLQNATNHNGSGETVDHILVPPEVDNNVAGSIWVDSGLSSFHGAYSGNPTTTNPTPVTETYSESLTWAVDDLTDKTFTVDLTNAPADFTVTINGAWDVSSGHIGPNRWLNGDDLDGDWQWRAEYADTQQGSSGWKAHLASTTGTYYKGDTSVSTAHMFHPAWQLGSFVLIVNGQVIADTTHFDSFDQASDIYVNQYKYGNGANVWPQFNSSFRWYSGYPTNLCITGHRPGGSGGTPGNYIQSTWDLYNNGWNHDGSSSAVVEYAETHVGQQYLEKFGAHSGTGFQSAYPDGTLQNGLTGVIADLIKSALVPGQVNTVGLRISSQSAYMNANKIPTGYENWSYWDERNPNMWNPSTETIDKETLTVDTHLQVDYTSTYQAVIPPTNNDDIYVVKGGAYGRYKPIYFDNTLDPSGGATTEENLVGSGSTAGGTLSMVFNVPANTIKVEVISWGILGDFSLSQERAKWGIYTGQTYFTDGVEAKHWNLEFGAEGNLSSTGQYDSNGSLIWVADDNPLYNSGSGDTFTGTPHETINPSLGNFTYNADGYFEIHSDWWTAGSTLDFRLIHDSSVNFSSPSSEPYYTHNITLRYTAPAESSSGPKNIAALQHLDGTRLSNGGHNVFFARQEHVTTSSNPKVLISGQGSTDFNFNANRIIYSGAKWLEPINAYNILGETITTGNEGSESNKRTAVVKFRNAGTPDIYDVYVDDASANTIPNTNIFTDDFERPTGWTGDNLGSSGSNMSLVYRDVFTIDIPSDATELRFTNIYIENTNGWGGINLINFYTRVDGGTRKRLTGPQGANHSYGSATTLPYGWWPSAFNIQYEQTNVDGSYGMPDVSEMWSGATGTTEGESGSMLFISSGRSNHGTGCSNWLDPCQTYYNSYEYKWNDYTNADNHWVIPQTNDFGETLWEPGKTFTLHIGDRARTSPGILNMSIGMEIDTSSSITVNNPPVAETHWDASQLTLTPNWATITDPETQISLVNEDIVEATGQSYSSGDSVASATSPWTQNISDNPALLDTYGYSSIPNNGFSGGVLTELCITREPIASIYRPSSDIEVELDITFDRSLISQALREIVVDIHNKSLLVTDQTFSFKHIAGAWSIYDIGNTQLSTGATDQNSSSTRPFIVNSLGQRVDILSYGPFGQKDFFAREGEYIKTTKMKITTEGHIFLTLETNSSLYGSIITQGKVTIKV